MVEAQRSHLPGPRLDRDLRLFQLYRFLSTSYLFVPVLLLFFESRGLSVTQITLLNTVYCGTLILFEVPTGALADRWGRKRAMVLGSLLMAVGALLDWAGHSFAVFAVGDGLLALGMTLSSGADSAYLFDLLRAAGREREYRRREGAASAAKLVGTAVALCAGGWLAGRNKDYAITYLVTAGVCLGASAVAALLHEGPNRSERRRAILSQIWGSARVVVSHRALLFAVLFSTLVFTLVRMSMYLYQPYLSRAGFRIEDVGLLLAGLSLAAAVGAHRIESLRRAVGERGLLIGLPAILAVSYLLLGGSASRWGIFLLLIQSILNGVYSPFSKELLNREIEDSSERATVLSVESMARRLAFGAFAPLCGLLIDARGQTAGLYACAGLGIVGTLALGARLLGRRLAGDMAFDTESTPTPLPHRERAPISVDVRRA